MAQSVDLFSMQNPRRGTRRFRGSTQAAARARRAPAPAAPAPATKKRRARRAPAAPVSAEVQETTSKSLYTPWLGGINKQFYDLMSQFEQDFKKMSVYGSSTKTKENYKHWPDHVYTDGKANQLFQAYLWGYWNGKGLTDTRSNPDSVKAIYQKFNGRPSRRSRNVAAPAGTPRDLAQLGRLRTIKTVDGRTWRFPGDRAPFLAADSRGRLHIVGGQYRANPAGEDCGEIDLIEYQTRKPHLGHDRETIYYHKLGEDTGERPTLEITPEGELVIHGGAYRIESDGIHN